MFAQLEIHERLLKALEKLGFSQPTAIQNALIPVALSGADLQASAETGSGKTAAFVLPVLQRFLLNPAPSTATRCLILLPTRELASQIHRQVEELAAFTQIKAALLMGGGSFKEQQALIRKNPEIIIGTPGRVREHVDKRSLDLQDLEVLVLDEADRMLDMGFRDEVLSIVRACNTQRQTLLLSATLQHDALGRIAREVLVEPQVIALGSHREQHGSIRQQVILADDKGHKQQLLNWLLGNEDFEKALVFCNTRDTVDELVMFLQRSGNRAAALHGEMSQDDRQQVMQRYRNAEFKVLVATDLAARGLDVKGVNLVVNFGLARSGDEHVHRIGRTGRAGEQGLSICLISPQEWNRMESIARYLGIEFERREIAQHPARFKGPAKKARRKSAGDRKGATGKHKKAIPKNRQRHSFSKNIGKRRKPAAAGEESAKPGKSASSATPAKPSADGFAPLARKKDK